MERDGTIDSLLIDAFEALQVLALARYEELRARSLPPPENGSGRDDAATYESCYARSILRAMKNTFAGRSPRRRMKYGYHSEPNGT